MGHLVWGLPAGARGSREDELLVSGRANNRKAFPKIWERASHQIRYLADAAP